MLGVCITSSPLLSKALLGRDHSLRVLGKGPVLGTRPMLSQYYTWDIKRHVGLGDFNSACILLDVLLTVKVQLAKLHTFVLQFDVKYWMLGPVVYRCSLLSRVYLLATSHLFYINYNIISQLFFSPNRFAIEINPVFKLYAKKMLFVYS